MAGKSLGYFYAASTERTQRQLRAAMQAAGLQRCTVYVAAIFPRPEAVSMDLWADLDARLGPPDFILDAPALAKAPSFDLSQG